MSTAPDPNYALASFGLAGTFTFDALLSDGHHVTSKVGTATSGVGLLKRGTIVKIDPATGLITLVVAATDANAVVAENCDATSAAVACLVYLTGKMKADALIWPALPHGPVADNLRDFGIVVESVLFRDGVVVRSQPNPQQEGFAKQAIEKNRAKLGEPKKAEEYDLGEHVAESPWGHLTAEEKEKNPGLGNPPREDEDETTEGEEGDEGEGGGTKTAKPKTPPATPPGTTPKTTPPYPGHEPGKSTPPATPPYKSPTHDEPKKK